MLSNKETNINIYSDWELQDNQRKRFVYNGVSFNEEIHHIRRQINSLVGGRDVAFYEINFLTSLNKGDRIRLEVENKTSISNVTVEIDSTFIVTQI